MNNSPIGTCRLCQTQGVELRNSHILSKWTYRRALSDMMKNRHPLHITESGLVQHSKQIREYMLCDACEDRFGKWERVAADLSYQKDGRAPILDRVAREGYRSPEGLEGAIFVDPEVATTLARFFLSIVWRAHESVHLEECNLGKDAESVRQYLLGAAELPSSVAVLLYFFEDSPAHGSGVSRTVVPPSSRKCHEHLAHRFLIHGFDVDVCVGDRVPDLVREFCLIHAPVKRLLLEPTDEIVRWLEPGLRRHIGKGPARSPSP